jgi:hypothetical protein
MTTIQSEAHDPMTYREPPRRGPAPVSGVEFQACARRACEGRLDVTYVAPEKRAAFAEIHGYVTEDGKAYCSKRCVALHKMTTPAGNGAVHKTARIEALRIPARVTVVPTTDRHDNVVAWLRCDRAACPTRVESPSTVMDEAARAAGAHGFVEVSYGTFCSASCATQARLDIESGIQPAPRGEPIAPREPIQSPKPVQDTEGVTTPVAVSVIADLSYQERLAASKGETAANTSETNENRKARRERERLAAALAK